MRGAVRDGIPSESLPQSEIVLALHDKDEMGITFCDDGNRRRVQMGWDGNWSRVLMGWDGTRIRCSWDGVVKGVGC